MATSKPRTSFRLIRDTRVWVPWDAEDRPTFTKPETVWEYMRPLAEIEIGEVVWVLPLDVQHQLLTEGPVVVSRGSLSGALFSVTSILATLLKLDALNFIMVHNHPSGNAAPSPEDKEVTLALAAVTKLHDGMTFTDHVIVGARTYYSFAADALI